MNSSRRHAFRWVALAALLGLVAGQQLLAGVERKTTKGDTPGPTRPWSLAEALEHLKASPGDPYLQFVVMQLAWREKKTDEIGQQVEAILFDDGGRVNPRSVDLFGLFTGASAVQESLQLDAMRGTPLRSRGRRDTRPMEKIDDPKKAEQARLTRLAKRRQDTVKIESLGGPTVKSHPWGKLLGNRKPEISLLARAVPEDFYYVESRSPARLLEVLDRGDLWSRQLFSQLARDGRSAPTSAARVFRQLALENGPRLLEGLEQAVTEVVVCGSDLYFQEGTDITVLFQVKKPDLLRVKLEEGARNLGNSVPGITRKTGKYRGVDYVHLATPDRQISVLAGDLAQGVHVRSTSAKAFERVVDAHLGKDAKGKPAPSLGDSLELRYMRTLMPRGAKEEDVFIYLSDPLIRKLVGPRLRLTELRRQLCYNGLKMIGHAALLHRTEHGAAATSLDALARARCVPGHFNKGELVCPCGGKYSLAADGITGVCSHHGQAHFLTPCCEIALDQVNGVEADEYTEFLRGYNEYWKTYFDPIALRIQIAPERYRVETIVLPLIENSIYTALAHGLGGKPEPLNEMPVPKRNIFSLNVRLNKAGLLKDAAKWLGAKGADLEKASRDVLREMGVPKDVAQRLGPRRLEELINKGLGNQVGLHIYDAEPLLDLNYAAAMGFLASGGAGSVGLDLGLEAFLALAIVPAINGPVYLAVPVRDVKLVDHFLDDFDVALAAIARKKGRGGFATIEQDFYKLIRKGKSTIRAYGIRIGPVKLHLWWARIGNGLYLASQRVVLDDLAALEARNAGKPKKIQVPDSSTVGNAMVRIRPENWKRILPDSQLFLAESSREACLKNLAPLSHVGRALAFPVQPAMKDTARSWNERGDQARTLAERVHAVRFFCPEGGIYGLSQDAKTCRCSLHGSVLAPRQAEAPDPNSPLARLTKDLSTLTATLTFREEGLFAVVTIDRKK